MNKYVLKWTLSACLLMVFLPVMAQDTNDDWTHYRDVIENAIKNNNKKAIEPAAQQMFAILRRTKNVEGLIYGCRVNSSVRDSCLILLHHAYTENGNIRVLEQFYYDVPIMTNNKVYNAFREKDEKVISAYEINKVRWSDVSMDNLICAAAPYYCAYDALQGMILLDVKKGRWNDALKKVKRYEKLFAGDCRYMELKAILEQEVDSSIVPTALPNGINTKAREYVPQLSGDGKTLYFCGEDREDNIGGEDLYEAKCVGGVWQSAHVVKELSTAKKNEAHVSVSVDGNSLILFRSGKLCISEKTEQGWSDPQELPSTINFSNWQADARITADGRAMLFAAHSITEREVMIKPQFMSRDNDPYNQTNIFVSLLQEDGTWGQPIELGPTINTSLCDRAPFLHPDMKTLYFCSNGHGGLGEMDVYRSRRLREDSWTEWSEPENLGKEINTIGDNCWYIISTDGQTAYYTARIDSTKEDIYQLPLPAHLRPNKVATVSGVLTDKKGQPLDAEIIWEDLSTHQRVGSSRSNPTDGSFFIVLPQGKIYGYYIDKDGFFPVAENIDLREVKDMVEVNRDIQVVTYQQMIDEQIPMPLNNLFFPTGQSSVLPESQSELRRMAKIIRDINAKVEISGHTDNVGNDNANQLLSEQRAKAVYEFLVNEGCDPKLLQWKGYGKNRPIADNQTEEGRQKNRRVELRFVK